MDSTKRPLKIPPEFSLYAEKHGVFDLYKNLLQLLIIKKPENPIEFLIDTLKKDNQDTPAVFVLGPPASGKYTIGKMISGRLRCPHLTMKSVIQEADRELKGKAEFHLREKEPIPTELWVKLMKHRLSVYDCNRKGYVISGFPQTRDQMLALQSEGIFPSHAVLLECADTVLVERAGGKRVDPENGDIYHLTFDPPIEEEVEGRLELVPGNTEPELIARLTTFRRQIRELQPCFNHVSKVIDADQPLADIFATSVEFCCSAARSAAPRNPRVILLGPPGSGKRTQAALLANKYRLVHIDCGQLVHQAIADDIQLGQAMKSYVEKKMNVPDALILKLLSDRLSQLDCVTRGWVMHGYPRTREQAEQLTAGGFEANRVMLLYIPGESVLERLTNRLLDPVTGERYHSIYNMAPNEIIANRLIQHPRDEEIEVKRRLARFNAYSEEIMDLYVNAQVIPADQDIHHVFEILESYMVNPIPKKYN